MPCYTRVRITLDNDAHTRAAVAALGFRYERQGGCTDMRLIVGWREKGYRTADDAARAIRQEAGILRTIAETRRLAPRAIIRRDGNTLSVQVGV